jgi:hypothetical protein
MSYDYDSSRAALIPPNEGIPVPRFVRGDIVMGSLLLRVAMLIIGVGGSGGVSRLGAQAPDSSTRALRGIIEGLPPAAAVRLGVGRERWTGRLARSSNDSLTLNDETGVRQVELADIDSLWLRGPRKHQGLMAGAGLGALVFIALQLTDDSGLQRGAKARQGFTVILGAAAIGMLMDGISDPWVPQFPE